MKLFSLGKGLGIQADRLHLIGFSHGSHVASLIGKRTDGNVKHITLLDPSAGKSHLLTWENLFGKGWTASKSAKFVDMYKTSNLASTHYARGDKSFYVRQKGTQTKEQQSNDYDDLVVTTDDVINDLNEKNYDNWTDRIKAIIAQ
jgi:pimeloyl-ACP methyl ester carboxylesterase